MRDNLSDESVLLLRRTSSAAGMVWPQVYSLSAISLTKLEITGSVTKRGENTP
jgi:hypothetical protein